MVITKLDTVNYSQVRATLPAGPAHGFRRSAVAITTASEAWLEVVGEGKLDQAGQKC